MNAKKTLSMTLAAAMAAGLLAGCGGSSSTAASSTSTSTESKAESTAASTEATTDAAGKVYYLNFKPEQDEAWQNLAKKYTEETGVPVTVVTAASGQYETTLMSEMAKSDAPTLFQVNGPVGLANWKDYCYDLTGTKILGDLTSDSYALKDGDATLGIGYVIESYGLITNKTLLEKAGYKAEDIKSFEDLAGKTTANSPASTYMELAESYGATVQGIDTLEETIQLLTAGRIDATLNADVSFYDYLNVHPDADFKLVAFTEEASHVAIPLRKGDETATLLEAINNAIEELRADGTLSELGEKYFGQDISSEI